MITALARDLATRWTYEIIRHLVETGVDPDPVVVLHTARERPPADTTPQ